MNSNELSPAESQKLFNEISQAVHNSDSVKLSEVMSKQPSEEKEIVKDPPDDTSKEDEEQPDDTDDKTNDDPPDDKAGQDDESKDDKAKDKKDEEPDELTKLKEQLDKLQKENHSLKSNAGRVPQVQRKIHELDKKLEELTKASPSSQTSTAIKPKLDELLKGVKSTDPELADAVAAAITQALEGVAQESHTKELENIKLLRDQELIAYQEGETQRLLNMYPNAAEVFKSPSWSEWKKTQPGGIRALCESDNADDVSYAFEKYANDMRAKYPELAKETENKSKDVPDPAAAERAKQLEQERQRKKTTAANVDSPNSSGKVKMPDDPDALFKKYADDIRKQRLGG